MPLEPNHTHLFIYCLLAAFIAIIEEFGSCDKLCGPQSLKHLLISFSSGNKIP